MRVGFILALPLVVAACGGGGMNGLHSSSVECAPYARQVTGVQLYGAAASWWNQAAGRYARTDRPDPGDILVFERSRRLPSGHVSVVSRVVSSRSILVTQANWVHHMIAHDEPVVDVSPGNDWSIVRVWWAPSGQMGVTPYATYGFIHPGPDREPAQLISAR